MPVSENSINALRNPEVVARSLATRRQNKENREQLKQKLAYEKFNNGVDKLVGTIKNKEVEDSNLNLKLSKLEYTNKALDSMVDNLKEQTKFNTSRINEIINRPVTDTTETIDITARDKINSFEEIIELLEDKLEQNNTGIADLYAKITDQECLKQLNQKIDNLFQLFYNTQHKTEYINKYCEQYNTQVQHPISNRMINVLYQEHQLNK